MQNSYSPQKNWPECFSPLLSTELHTLFSTSVLSNNSGRNRILESLTTLFPRGRLLVIVNRTKFSLAYFVPDSNQTFCSCISQWFEKIKTLLGNKSFLFKYSQDPINLTNFLTRLFDQIRHSPLNLYLLLKSSLYGMPKDQWKSRVNITQHFTLAYLQYYKREDWGGQGKAIALL